MIDIHCHILPEFDDGSSCTEESIDMARLAAESGVTDIVCTSHLNCREDDPKTVSDRIEKIYRKLCTDLKASGIPINLLLGAEIMCIPETPLYLEKKLLPTVAGTDYVLIEFPFEASGEYISTMLSKIRELHYRPVLAHPERYSASRRHPELVAEWFRKGYVLQLNKGSILGAFGRNIRHTALEMLDRGLCHVIASDAHSAVSRTPSMSNLIDFLNDRYRPEYIALLLDENPGRIIANRDTVSV